MYRNAVSSCPGNCPMKETHIMLSSLTMAEMTTLVAAIYRKYSTTTKGGFDLVSPGITARYEVFYEESCNEMRVSLGLLRYLIITLILFRSMNVKLSSHVSGDLRSLFKIQQ